MSENIREIILDTLLTIDTQDKKSHLLIRDVLNKYDYLDGRDKAFFKRVTEGTLSKRITLDYVLNKYSKKPVEKCKPVVKALLRMSAYQILFLDKVPDSAAINEAVNLCKKRSFKEFVPFINGVLRSLCNDKDRALDFSDIKENTKRISVTYSCPEWIVDLFQKETKDAESLLKAMDTIKATCVHIVNDDSKEELLKAWKEKNIEYKESEYVNNSYLLKNIEGMDSVPGFLEGKLMVQDESSQLCALATGVNEKSDLTVFDTCAAPGGKTCFVASKMKDKGHVLSMDVSDLKVSLISENVERLGLKNVEVKVSDATEFDESLFEKADCLIADVPCSGLGVFARKSDIKFNVTNEGMKEICDLQKKILLNVSKYVKPGGVLIYSTCTIHKAENEKMVKFIEENLPFKGDSLKPIVPNLFKVERKCDYAVSLLPHIDNTDGFFIARFIKNAE